MRVYAIGDIHGQLPLLEEAHARIAADRAETGDDQAPVVHLGDFVDRGSDARGVIDYLIDGIGAQAPWIVLRGNHDQLFLDHLEAAGFSDTARTPSAFWLDPRMGGRETLASYDIQTGFLTRYRGIRREMREKVPDAHVAFLRDLRPWFETDDLIFVHAGIRPGLALTEQILEDLIWIRGGFLDDPRDHGRLVVHGHTPVDEPMHCGNRIALDTGAAYGGPLTTAVFEGRDVWVLGEEGRVPLLPTGEV